MTQSPVIICPDGTETSVMPNDGKKFSLDELQDIVKGYVEITHTKDGRKMVCNESGVLDELPLNSRATDLLPENMFGNHFLGIRGIVLVTKRFL